MRLIDADELKEHIRWSEIVRLSIIEIIKIIDDAETVEPYNKDETYIRGYDDGFKAALREAKKGSDIF